MKIKNIIRIIIISIILFLLHSCNIPGGYLAMTKDMKFRAEKILFYSEIKDKPFSEELLKKVIWYEKIRNPEVVLLQAQLETGFYTSDIFLSGHNCFGMKHPKYRQTVAIGTYQGHAQYNNWIDSVIDYKIWQDWFKSIGYRFEGNQSSEYMVFLKCIRYAEDPRYIHKLVKLQNEKDLT
jgi:hypothetical protein